MNVIDIIIIGVLGLAAVKGYLKGFIIEFFSFIAFFVGLFIAIEFTSPIAVEYFGDSDYFGLLSVAVFIGLFLVLTLAINILAKITKKAVDLTFFGLLDNALGAIMGALKWALIASVILWIFDSVGLEISSPMIDRSSLFPYLVVIGPMTFEAISGFIPFFQDIFDSMDKFKEQGRWT